MSVLRPICPVCQTSEKLLRCQGCLVTLYCCRDHQIADRSNHKVACNAVKKARNVLEQEDRELRDEPMNMFEMAPGNFYEIALTRNYIKARFSLVRKLMKLNTYDGVKAALDHATGILQLCHLDHVGVRFIAPFLFIRLGKDQDSYDLIKSVASFGAEGLDDLEIVSHLDLKGADVFEPVILFDKLYLYFQLAVPLMLIKIRLLNDVKMLQNSLFMYEMLPPELVDRIRKEAIVTEVVSRRKDIYNSTNQKPLIEALEKEIWQLFVYINRNYPHFWPNILDPKDSFALKPDSRYKNESEEYSQMVVQYCYEAYAETPFAMEMVRDMADNDE